MAWFGNVSLGNFPDLAGAVNKLSESVKNIEKNFDSALGLEEKEKTSASSEGNVDVCCCRSTFSTIRLIAYFQIQNCVADILVKDSLTFGISCTHNFC